MNMVLLRRFQVADDELRYSLPSGSELYTQPWTGEMPMRPSSGLYEYSCHGNHACLVFGGARVLKFRR